MAFSTAVSLAFLSVSTTRCNCGPLVPTIAAVVESVASKVLPTSWMSAATGEVLTNRFVHRYLTSTTKVMIA
jgi:hypothetical protein